MAENARGMHPARIMAEIKVRHGSAQNLALKLKVDPSAISHVLTEPLFSRGLERKIAVAIGVSLHAIWPDRWTEDGRARPRSQRAQIAVPSRSISSQKQKVA